SCTLRASSLDSREWWGMQGREVKWDGGSRPDLPGSGTTAGKLHQAPAESSRVHRSVTLSGAGRLAKPTGMRSRRAPTPPRNPVLALWRALNHLFYPRERPID